MLVNLRQNLLLLSVLLFVFQMPVVSSAESAFQIVTPNTTYTQKAIRPPQQKTPYQPELPFDPALPASQDVSGLPLPPSNYFTFDTSDSLALKSMAPWDALSIESIESTMKNLLSWIHHDTSPDWPTEKYQRTAQFGRWINDPTDDTCWNTRAQVLVRDSRVQVTFKGQRKCTVDTGEWLDPYTGQIFTSSPQIQIDHLVPLKHAYQAGAWKWDYQTRCLYANFTGNKFHLISASGHENMAKGDKSPDRYVPPKRDYDCEYVKNWLQVKMIWNLEILPDEAAGIKALIQQNSCNIQDFTMTDEMIKTQRQYIQSHMGLCKARNL